MRCQGYDSEQQKPCESEATHKVQYTGESFVFGKEVQDYCERHTEQFRTAGFAVWEARQ